MSLFDPEQPTAFNEPQSMPRRSFELPHGHRRSNRHGRHNSTVSVPDRISTFYRRYRENNTCNQSQSSYSSLTSSKSDIIEMLFSRIVDALIFTSAIAITAYNYWMGSLDSNPAQPSVTSSGPATPTMDIRQWRQTHAPKLNHDVAKQPDFLEDSKRQRTQHWAESMAKQQQHVQQQHVQQQHSRPKSKLVQFPNEPISKSDPAPEPEPSRKRRTQSLPPPKKSNDAQAAHKEDEMLSRMEERLQSLIEEGQAALTSKVELYELDENEIAMRKAFAARKKYSV
ncbi:hypothetical protein BJV82DRAFT_663230 [Fennellomyces sp. T-0311]|nr:hypothetical protein BJV82DRAFT_663230 [Fennellomyces sp. T-0311]